MRGGPDERDAALPAAPTPRWRTAGLVAGAVLAVAATVVVFLTDDARLLRLAVLGGAWSFVLALLAAGRRRDPAGGPAGLRQAHELELERAAAGRREAERETESRIRRESDDAMRAEIAALRQDVASLGAVRQELAALGALRADVAALTALRSDVAELTTMRSDVAALGELRRDVAVLGSLREDVVGPGGLREEVARLAALRAELGQVAELRADVGRLRAELTEQLSSEMFLERVVMRTQSSRGPAGTMTPAAPVEGPSTLSIDAVSWSDEPPRELTGGWPAVRLDAPPSSAQPAPQAPWSAPQPVPGYQPPPVPAPAYGVPVAGAAVPEAPVTRGYEALEGLSARRAAAPTPEPAPVARPAAGEDSPRRRRRTDPATAEQVTVERPRAAGESAAPVEAASLLDAWPRPPAPLPPDPLPSGSLPSDPLPTGPRSAAAPSAPLTVQAPGVPTPGEARLAQILAESGSPDARPRRRHRYRDDDEDDDVLARVLRRH
ncbi:DUF6779 domain-containing protein [Blastococcus sp. SYSU D00695]